MKHLRRHGGSGTASDHLAKLTLQQRAVRLVRAGGSASIVSARIVKDTVHKSADFVRSITDEDDLNERASGNISKTGRSVAGRATKQAQRAGQGAVKGGLAAARNRAAARSARATAQASGSVAKPAALASARASAAAAHMVRAAVSAAVSALSSTPVLLTIAAIIAAVIVVVMTLSWLIPGYESQQKGPGDVGSFAMIDDYPYKGKYSEDDYSPMGYAWGNCTDFVAWRVNRDAGHTKEPWQLTWGAITPNGGDGAQWGDDGNLPGWTTTRTPVPGDIISVRRAGILGNSTNMPGHVAYVGAVDGAGTVTIENYGHGRYFLTTATVSELAGYIDGGGVTIKHNPAGRIGGIADGDPNGDAKGYALQSLGGDTAQYQCLDRLWTGESNWNVHAENPSSGAYGIPQALPADKLATAGSDWRDSFVTQINWGLRYIGDRYGTPCEAWAFWQSNNPHWY